MGKCRIMYNNLWDSGTLTASTENPNFPASNTRHRWFTRPWRSTAIATTQWLKVDLGLATSVSVVIMRYNNFSSGALVQIQGNVGDEWTSPQYSSSPLSVNNTIMVHFLPVSQTLTWWRIAILDDSNPDGYLLVGRVFLGSYFEPTRTFIIGRPVQPVDPSLISYSEGGQISTVLRQKYDAKSYTFVSTTQKTAFDAVYTSRGNARALFFCEDIASPNSKTQYVRIGNWVWQHLHDDRWNLQITLEEER